VAFSILTVSPSSAYDYFSPVEIGDESSSAKSGIGVPCKGRRGNERVKKRERGRKES
jgi:hypothetical protein